MKVDICRGNIHTVDIYGGTGTYISLSVSPQEAYELLLALDLKREELRDLANNFWDCPDCGNTHPKSLLDYPNFGAEET